MDVKEQIKCMDQKIVETGQIEVRVTKMEEQVKCIDQKKAPETRILRDWKQKLSGIIGCGSLELDIGPMMSGKTKTLCSTLTEYADAFPSSRVCLISHLNDTRDTHRCGIITSHHSSFFLSEKVDQCALSRLADFEHLDRYQFIGIDEGQFFPDLLQTVTSWLSQGKHIRVAGLDGDYQKKPFGEILFLIPHANDVRKHRSRCPLCIRELEGYHGNILDLQAPYTARLSSGSEQIEVGADDKYIPTCYFHHQEITEMRNKETIKEILRNGSEDIDLC